MLRGRFKFQTKIMIAVMIAVILVTIAVEALTERKVRTTYQRIAEAQFAEQVEGITSMRRTRQEGAARMLERMAEMPQVQQVFANSSFGFKEIEIAKRSIRDLFGDGKDDNGVGVGGGGRPGFGPSISNRLICLVSPEGKLFPINGLKVRNREGRDRALGQFSGIEDFDAKQYGFLIVENENGEATPLEVVVSPVEIDGKVAGALLTGQLLESPSESEEGKSPIHRLRRMNPLADRGLIEGLYVDGELFFPEAGSDEVHSGIAAAVARLIADPEGTEHLEFQGKNYRLFLGNLTSEGATLPPTYQVVLYPIETLLADLRDLRLKGSGIGLVAVLFGILLAWLVSRNLARPIIELVRGTEEIQGGNFAARVTPRSKDEIGALATSFNEMAEGLEMREQLRDVLGKVSDATVAQALIEGNLELGGEMRRVSILFCDIRGFTSMTESMPPTEVIELVNDHMTAMTEIVHRNKGVVDKFVGDEIMAIFGAPKPYGNDAENASACAQEMVERRAEMNRGMSRPIEIGVGVATGDVIVGCMGSVDRLNYTVLGERVNRASRLCGLAAPGEAIIDDATAEKLGEATCEVLPPVSLKGYSAPLTVYRLVERELAPA